MSEHEEAFRRNKDQLIELGDKVGGWSPGSIQIYKKSVNLTIRFDNPVDVATAEFFVDVLLGCPSRLVNAYRLLLGEEQVTE